MEGCVASNGFKEKIGEWVERLWVFDLWVTNQLDGIEVAGTFLKPDTLRHKYRIALGSMFLRENHGGWFYTTQRTKTF